MNRTESVNRTTPMTRTRALLASLALVVVAPSANAQDYVATRILTLDGATFPGVHPGSRELLVGGQSSGGTTVAVQYDATGVPLLLPGATSNPFSLAWGTSPAGDVVGQVLFTGASAVDAVIWPAGGGAATPLAQLVTQNPSNLVLIDARFMNAAGEIVGYASSPLRGSVGYFMDAAGVVHELSGPNGASFDPSGLTDGGLVVGSFSQGFARAATWSVSQGATNLHDPSRSVLSAILGCNPSGTLAVGTHRSPGGQNEHAVWDLVTGQMTVVPSATASPAQAQLSAVNDGGEAVGHENPALIGPDPIEPVTLAGSGSVDALSDRIVNPTGPSPASLAWPVLYAELVLEDGRIVASGPSPVTDDWFYVLLHPIPASGIVLAAEGFRGGASEPARLKVGGAEPGASVLFAVSLPGANALSLPQLCGGVTLDVSRSSAMLVRATADWRGFCEIELPLPAALSGRLLTCDAIATPAVPGAPCAEANGLRAVVR